MLASHIHLAWTFKFRIHINDPWSFPIESMSEAFIRSGSRTRLVEIDFARMPKRTILATRRFHFPHPTNVLCLNNVRDSSQPMSVCIHLNGKKISTRFRRRPRLCGSCWLKTLACQNVRYKSKQNLRIILMKSLVQYIRSIRRRKSITTSYF